MTVQVNLFCKNMSPVIQYGIEKEILENLREEEFWFYCSDPQLRIGGTIVKFMG